MPAALILDHGASRSALAGARGLAAAGWRVVIGSPAAATLAGASRGVERTIGVPGPEAGLDAFAAAIDTAAAERAIDVVLPSDDHQMLGLSLRRADVRALVPYPPHDVVVRATDKLELHRAASAAGLASPVTEEASDQTIARWTLPAIVKPRLHFPMVDPDAPAHLPVSRVLIREQLVSAAAEIRASGGTPLLQEPIDGEHLSVTVVADRESRIVAALQQLTTRLYPAEAGISARAVSLPVDADLLARIERLLADLRWTGLAQLQFRARPGDSPRLIDFNGRLYGSLALGLHAGVNLPAAWADSALGRPVAGPVHGRAGASYQWLEGDLRSAFAERGPRALPGVLAYALRSGHSIWDPRDPAPALALARSYARRTAGRLHARGTAG